jgi:hypothetical protein
MYIHKRKINCENQKLEIIENFELSMNRKRCLNPTMYVHTNANDMQKFREKWPQTCFRRMYLALFSGRIRMIR